MFHIFVILLIVWMLRIFSFSAQTADKSSNLSGEIGRKVASIFMPGFQTWEESRQDQFIEKIDFFVRKTAHFTEYMVLGMLWIVCLQSNPKGKFVMAHNMWISMIVSVCFAMSDEFHQLFVAGRAGRWMNVGIDTASAVAGVCLVGFGIKLFKNTAFHKEK